jgi:hypothetical protein
MIKQFLVFTLCFILFQECALAEQKSEIAEETDVLKAVIVLATSGAHEFSYKYILSMPENAPSLLSVGARQEYIIGRYLRQKYMEDTPILYENYNDFQVMVHSSKYNQNLQSAYALLMGLFLPGSGPSLSAKHAENAVLPMDIDQSDIIASLQEEGLPHFAQVTVIKDEEGAKDYLLDNIHACSSIMGNKRQTREGNEEVKQKEKEFQEVLFKEISEQIKPSSEINLKMAAEIGREWNNLKYEDYKSDISFTEKAIEQLNEAIVYELNEIIFKEKLSYQLMGKILFEKLNDLFDEFYGNVHESHLKKFSHNMSILFTDDYTFIPFLKILSYSLVTPIPAGSILAMELSQNKESISKPHSQLLKSDFSVAISLNTKIYSNEKMGLDKLQDLIEENTILKGNESALFELDCKDHEPTPVDNSNWQLILIISGAITLAVLITLVVIICYFINRKIEGIGDAQAPASKDKDKEKGKGTETGKEGSSGKKDVKEEAVKTGKDVIEASDGGLNEKDRGEEENHNVLRTLSMGDEAQSLSSDIDKQT